MADEVVQELIRLVAPRLRYDSDEAFHVTAAGAAVDAPPPGIDTPYVNVLRVPPEDEIVASTDPARVQGDRLSLEYLGLRGSDTRSEWIDITYSPDGEARSLADHQDVAQLFSRLVYGRAVRDPDDGRLWLQYWLYYYYDDKSVLRWRVRTHEGDWEWVQYRLSERAASLLEDRTIPEFASQLESESVDLVDELTYSAHDEAFKSKWAKAPREPVTGDLALFAPVVFVARGSHANYFATRGKIYDRTDGKVGPITPEVEDISNPPDWVFWKGRWGSRQAPTGPSSKNAWSSPSAFHASADDWSKIDFLVRLEDTTLDPPSIRIAGASEAAIDVEYSVTQPVFARLTATGQEPIVRVSARRRGRREPARVSIEPLATPRDVVTVKTPSGSGPLLVQCSVIGSDGTTTETAEIVYGDDRNQSDATGS